MDIVTLNLLKLYYIVYNTNVLVKLPVGVFKNCMYYRSKLQNCQNTLLIIWIHIPKKNVIFEISQIIGEKERGSSKFVPLSMYALYILKNYIYIAAAITKNNWIQSLSNWNFQDFCMYLCMYVCIYVCMFVHICMSQTEMCESHSPTHSKKLYSYPLLLKDEN